MSSEGRFALATIRGKTLAILREALGADGMPSMPSNDEGFTVLVPMWIHSESEGRLLVTVGSRPISKNVIDCTIDEARRTCFIPSRDLEYYEVSKFKDGSQ